ncbi:hypothetical protein PR048_002554 [Dryococelus australis]|uniref:Uncharacterized protein n=1 Tax=Dryococelus australis TaxID=614101 RepID=A0ABQ9IKH8_9NEOP|nr:hypothetical protein PR048_002554 [Dryococelus australis]
MFVPSDTADLQYGLRNSEFLRKIAFLEDITGYLNKLKMKLQGKDYLMSKFSGTRKWILQCDETFQCCFGEKQIDTVLMSQATCTGI